MYNIYTKDNDGVHQVASNVDYKTAEKFLAECSNVIVKDANPEGVEAGSVESSFIMLLASLLSGLVLAIALLVHNAL